jgi:acetoin utilization deacetylase AcuC-like enzyme
MVVGLIQDAEFLRHETGDHPEAPARLEAVRRRLEAAGISSAAASAEPRAAERAELEAVHRAEFVDHVAWVCRAGLPLIDAADTAVCRVSYEVALLAAGAGLVAADRIVAGEWRSAFAAVRPPGHHAEHAQAMGFCLFNNVAVAARYLQRRHGIGRVVILDWDVHHGNGTQHAFEEDPSVYYISLHQWPFYPGTGAAWERGRGAGTGTTLNVPLPHGTTDRDYLKAFETKVLPEIDAYAPEFILISAGFDAHRDDPLGGMRLSDQAFVEMTRSVLDLARRHCEGRVLSLLEGGYDLDALARCVELHVAELMQAS